MDKISHLQTRTGLPHGLLHNKVWPQVRHHLLFPNSPPPFPPETVITYLRFLPEQAPPCLAAARVPQSRYLTSVCWLKARRELVCSCGLPGQGQREQFVSFLLGMGMLLQVLKRHFIRGHFVMMVMRCSRNLILDHISLTMVKLVWFLWCCFKSQNLKTVYIYVYIYIFFLSNSTSSSPLTFMC